MKQELLALTIFFLFLHLKLPAQEIFISEVHYDNDGTDAGEAIEITGPAGTDLNGWQIVLYNGSSGTPYSFETLSGILDDQAHGFGFKVVQYPANGIQNGSPDGIALVNSSGSVIQFLSYEGAFTAAGGPADGLSSTDIGVAESPSTEPGYSLQLRGNGTNYTDFAWQPATVSTFGAVNTGQTFAVRISSELRINEFVFNHNGYDTYEYVEIAGFPATDYKQYKLLAIEGDAGATGTIDGVFSLGTTDDNGLWHTGFLENKLENGTLTLLLVKNFTGNAGDDLDTNDNGSLDVLPWEGLVDEIAVSDAGSADFTYSSTVLNPNFDSASSAVGGSSRFSGGDGAYTAAEWVRNDFEGEGLPVNSLSARTGEAINTPGLPNKIKETVPEPQLMAIAEARSLPEGSRVKVQGVLTVAEQLGGPAYIQDETAGVAVFDKDIHTSGLYTIGDQLIITAEITNYHDQKQLIAVDPANIEIVVPATISIEPVTIALSDLEKYEGQLVKVKGVIFPEPGQLIFPNTDIAISDESGSGQLRIDNEVTGVTFKEQSVTCEEITGIVGRYKATPQLLPRFSEDIACLKEYTINNENRESKDTTLDVVTWNMEFFGAAQADFGPEDEESQFLEALQVIKTLDADLYALQEVSDESLLERLVDSLPHYALVCSGYYSYYFNPGSGFPAQRLCFIYNQRTIRPVENRAMFAELYENAGNGATDLLNDYPVSSPASFWASGRLPFMLVADVEQHDKTERVYFINVHAKSGSGDKDFIRRAYDAQVLKDSLDVYYSDKHVMILGDFNDDVDVSITSNRDSPYNIFTEDKNYTFYTKTLSAAGLRSTYYYGDMVDHILISDELYDNYLNLSEEVHYEVYHENYVSTTSDHFPVSLRLIWYPELAADKGQIKEETTGRQAGNEVSIYPLPARNWARIRLPESFQEDVEIYLYHLPGHRFKLKNQCWSMKGNEIEIDLEACGVKQGVYVIGVYSNEKIYRYLRLIVE